METYDCIVIGVGGIGSACLSHLARRGHRVLGLEQFDVPTDRGSSHGESRVIRQAYFEHPDYVPLLQAAYTGWSELAEATGHSLYQPTGILVAGPADGEAVAGCRLAAGQHNLAIENLTAAQAMGRFPGLMIPSELDVVFEENAGFLFVEDCVRAHVEVATANGAELKTRERVIQWESDGKGVRLLTDRGRYEASRLIVTARPLGGTPAERAEAAADGPPQGDDLACRPVGSHADRERRPGLVHRDPGRQLLWRAGDGGETVKIGEHTRGERVADPYTVDRGLLASDLLPVRHMLKQFLPGVSPEPSKHAVCMYTNSPDGHFIVDRHPGDEAVVLAAGLSGHGFKFAPVMGEALADLAESGTTELPIGFLGLSRFREP